MSYNKQKMKTMFSKHLTSRTVDSLLYIASIPHPFHRIPEEGEHHRDGNSRFCMLLLVHL